MKSIVRLIKALALSASLLAGGLAVAAPSITYSGGSAVGIHDLEVSGITYDVSFVFGPYESIFASNAPTFLGDEATANEAANAMLNVLDAASGVVIGTGANCCGILWVPFADEFQDDPDFFRATQTGYGDSTGDAWQRYGDYAGQKAVDRQERNWGFAVFTASTNAVPEPGSLLLVGLALAGVGLVRRRAY